MNSAGKKPEVNFVLAGEIPLMPALGARVFPDEIHLRVHHSVSPRELTDFYRKVRRQSEFKHQRERKKVADLNPKNETQQKRREESKLLKPGVDPIALLTRKLDMKPAATALVTTAVAMKRLDVSRATLYRQKQDGKIQRVNGRWNLQPKS